MTKAAALLVAGKTPKRVALDLNYRQYSHFAREFKRHHGTTASQFVHLVALDRARKKTANIRIFPLKTRRSSAKSSGSGIRRNVRTR
jgi:hypothetical protein